MYSEKAEREASLYQEGSEHAVIVGGIFPCYDSIQGISQCRYCAYSTPTVEGRTSIITIYYFCGMRDGTQGLTQTGKVIYYYLTLLYLPRPVITLNTWFRVDMVVQACSPNTWDSGAEDPKFPANLNNTMSSQPAWECVTKNSSREFGKQCR